MNWLRKQILKPLLAIAGIEGPMNGWKTISGVLAMWLPMLLPEADPTSVDSALVLFKEILTQGGAMLALYGALHKIIKNWFGNKPINIVSMFICGALLAMPVHVMAQTIFTDTLTVTPTITLAAYEANDNIGGKLSFQDADDTKNTSGLVISVVVTDTDGINADLDIVLFDTDLASTITDASPVTLVDADLLNIFCRISIEAADYLDYAANSFAYVTKNCPYRIDSAGSTFFAVVTTSGTPDYANTDALSFRISLSEDQQSK